MINSLHTDTYYRGYRLAFNPSTGQVDIYYSTDKVDTVTLETKGMSRTTTDRAKDIIDAWQNAR